MRTTLQQRGLQSTNRPARRRGKHSPLGRQLAALRKRGRDIRTRAECNPALGRELADHALHVATWGKLEGAARKRRDPKHCKGGVNGSTDRPLYEERKRQRSEEHQATRRIMALFLVLLEEVELVGQNRGRACHSGLWLGRTRTQLPGGAWVYVPADQQRGIAARIGVDVRELERMIGVLVGGGVLRAWQPPVTEETPEELRGETYAYNCYQLIGELPAALVGAILRWEERTKASDAAARHELERAAPADAPPAAGPDLGAMAATQAIADAIRGKPPPAPARPS